MKLLPTFSYEQNMLESKKGHV